MCDSAAGDGDGGVALATIRTIACGVQGRVKWHSIAACGGKLYCAPCNADSILVIDTSEADATYTINCGVRGTIKWIGIAECAGKLYCAPYKGDSVLVIDPSNADATRCIDCGVRGNEKWVGIAECAGKLYCAPHNECSILVIDPSNEDSVRTIVSRVRGTGLWSGIAECAGKLYCAPHNADSILVIDPSNADATRTIYCGVRGKSKWGSIAECAGTLFCAPCRAGSILVIDPSNADATRIIDCGVQGDLKWNGIAACAGKLYCAPRNADSILVIDPSRLDVTRTIDCGDREGGKWAGIVACAGKLYCAPRNADSVLVIEPLTGQEVMNSGVLLGDNKKIVDNTAAAAVDKAQQCNLSARDPVISLRQAIERVDAARSASSSSSSSNDSEFERLLEPVRAATGCFKHGGAGLNNERVEYVALDDLKKHLCKACTDRKNLDEAQDLVRGALSPDARNDGRLQSLVEQRDKARSAYVQALISLQTRYSSSDIGVERLVLEQDARRFEACLLALDNIRDDFFEAANPAAAAAAAANPAAVQAESASSLDSTTITIQAVRAFEHWEKITDPRAVSEPTNVAFADAWRKLCDVGEARGAKEARDAWEIAYRAALEAADREVEHWSSHSHPLSMLPVDAIRLAATARLEACRDNLLVLSRAQDQVLEARRDVEDIAVAESKAAAGEKPLREANKWSRTARKKFRESVRDLEDAQDEVEDAKMRDLEEVGGHEEEKGPDIDLLTERVRVARQEVHRAQRAAEDELSTYVELVRDHFPELGLCCAMEAIEAVVALSPALRSVVRQERSPQDYEKIPWPDYYSEPRASRHEVVACLYDGQACVLKQFHLRGASERRALEREVEVLVALAHPNILKLECVFFVEKNELASAEAFIQSPLYCGGSLRQWLSRPENRIDDGCAMEAESVAQWGGLRFLKAEKSRRVATTHVRALKQLLAALSHVHAKGVVHGDVKLDNALVDDPPDGTWTVILIDFDMSRTTTTTTTRDDGESITSAAATTRAGGGTPGYIAPEVRAGARSTAASDIFSYGVCVAVALAADDRTAERVLDEEEAEIKVDLQRQAAELRDDDTLAAVLCSCLLTVAAERPSACTLEASPLFSTSDAILADQAVAEMVARRTCLVCCDDAVVGVECTTNAHFVCDECLAGHVRASTDAESLRTFEARAGRIQCVGVKCDECYADAQIASRVPQHLFDAYIAAKRLLLEQRVATELEVGFDRRVQAEAQRIAELSEADRRARETRAHVVNHILTLACPRCGAAFVEVLDGENGFDGCFALTCHRPGCGCAFCAYCLADCGADAHHHVGKCALGRGLFPRRPRETLERAQRARRDRDLRAYLLTLADDEARTVLVAGLSTELSDLGLDPLAYLPR